MAHALFYLHHGKIIYRDLKSDNILVFSLDEEDPVNVKLSDYGISTFATPQGVLGEGGTPGFQAPEVKSGAAYDEKVCLCFNCRQIAVPRGWDTLVWWRFSNVFHVH